MFTCGGTAVRWGLQLEMFLFFPFNSAVVIELASIFAAHLCRCDGDRWHARCATCVKIDPFHVPTRLQAWSFAQHLRVLQESFQLFLC